MIVDKFSNNLKNNFEKRSFGGSYSYLTLIKSENETFNFCDLAFAWRWSFSNLIDFSDTPIEGSNPTSPTNGEETTVTPNTIRGKGEQPPFGGGSSYYNYPLGNSR